jgi:serine/threonine-protein kinase RsbW
VEGNARVEFALPAKPENVALVRHALAGLAEVLGMPPTGVADLKTAVTEACTNAVVHAYDAGDSGLMEVGAAVEDEHLVVVVRDFGEGIRPLADADRRSLRLGLPLMAALTDGFELSQSPGGGTTVSLRIPLAVGHEPGPPLSPVIADETRIDIAAGDALGPVLSRVISMFAARADLTVDRVADAVLLSDAISAGGDAAFPDGTARVAVAEDAGAFELRVGPLSRGGGQRLIERMRFPQINATLEALAEDVAVTEDADGDTVTVRVGATTPSPAS